MKGGSTYPTEKPFNLLDRIERISSKGDSIIADFFGGSGVTAAVAAKLGRRFIHCDIGLNSIQTTRDRLKVARFADLFLELGYNGDAKVMADDYIAALSRQDMLLDGALELITSLHGNCQLYIVTNGITTVQKSRFGRCALQPYFKQCFISEEMGCAKPEKIFFDRVAEAIEGFDPRKALVIGDSLSSDIQGGINAGIDTCWYNPRGMCAPAHMKITYTVDSLESIADILLN